MINLLPNNNRKQIINEYRHRRIVVGGVLLAILIFISTLFMVPLYLLLDFKKEALEINLSNLESKLNEEEIRNQKEELQKTKQRINLAQETLAYWQPVEILDLIQTKTVFGVEINQINFIQKEAENSTLNLRGKAEFRQNLLDFIRVLENSSSIAKVESPAANLLREAEIEFNLTIDIFD